MFVGRKTKTLLVSVFSQAVVNGNADRFDLAAVLIEQDFTDPIPIAIPQIPNFYFFIRHGHEK